MNGETPTSPANDPNDQSQSLRTELTPEQKQLLLTIQRLAIDNGTDIVISNDNKLTWLGREGVGDLSFDWQVENRNSTFQASNMYPGLKPGSIVGKAINLYGYEAAPNGEDIKIEVPILVRSLPQAEFNKDYYRLAEMDVVIDVGALTEEGDGYIDISIEFLLAKNAVGQKPFIMLSYGFELYEPFDIVELERQCKILLQKFGLDQVVDFSEYNVADKKVEPSKLDVNKLIHVISGLEPK